MSQGQGVEARDRKADTQRGQADSTSQTVVLLLLLMGTVYWLQNETAAFTSMALWTPNNITEVVPLT